MYNVGNQPTLNNTILFYINHLEQPETENAIKTNIITNFVYSIWRRHTLPVGDLLSKEMSNIGSPPTPCDVLVKSYPMLIAASHPVVFVLDVEFRY